MAMTQQNWTEVLEPILRTIFDKHIGTKKDYLPVIFNVEGSKKAVESNLGVGSLGTMDEWTGQVSYEELNKGYLATYRHKKFSKGLQIDRDLVDDDQTGEIRKRTKALAQSLWYTRQTHGASVFNNAFNASFLGPDSKPLCSASHPLAPGSASTWSNAGAYALNADNVEIVRNAMKAWTDDKGNLLAINPDTLIVPSALRKTALVIADSDKEPDTANNNVNVWKGSLNVIEHDFLTDANAWFLVDMERMKMLLNWYDRRKAVLESDGNTFDTEIGKWKMVGRWSYGWDDASFIYGCNPS